MPDLQTALSSSVTDTLPATDEIRVNENKKSLYCLWYRARNNPHPMTKNFFFDGDLRGAIARGRSHCEATNIVFIHVRPFLSDLGAEEKKLQGNYD